MLVAERAVGGGDPLAIVWVLARFRLVDEFTHGKRVILCCAKNQRLFVLVYLLHEQLHAVRFSFLDFDDLVEVGFRVALTGFNLTLDRFCQLSRLLVRRHAVEPG